MKVREKKYYLYEMNVNKLNIIAIIIMFFLFILTFIFYPEIDFFNKNCILLIILLIPYLVIHEILHAISYVIHGAKLQNITFGVHLEKGILCCLCKQNISKKNILISLLYPFIFIGVITYIIGLICHIDVLIILSIANMAGCAGDLMMFLSLIKIKDFEYSEYDNPISFALYSSEDLSNKKMFGLNFIETTDIIQRNDKKKIRISLKSIIFLSVYYLLFLILYLVR